MKTTIDKERWKEAVKVATEENLRPSLARAIKRVRAIARNHGAEELFISKDFAKNSFFFSTKPGTLHGGIIYFSDGWSIHT